MSKRTFIVPRFIYSGQGSLENLAAVAGTRAFIVTDTVIRQLGIVDRVEKMLHDARFETRIFDQVEPEPSWDTGLKVAAEMMAFQPDLIIGLGGGSAMDIGKVAWVIYEHPDMAELSFADFESEFRKRELRKKAKYVAIATSSGTGSEVTSSAVVTNNNFTPPYKAGLWSRQIIPDVAIVDPELTISMPPGVTANTGFDALIHAIECFVLIEPNDLVDHLALGAAATIFNWLPKAYENGRDINARDKMHTASLEAGMAFANGRLGAVHVPAHDLGAEFHFPHGLSNAFMLCPVFAWLYPSRHHRFDELAVALGIKGKDKKERMVNLLAALDRLKTAVGIPVAIRDTGRDEGEFMSGIDAIVSAYMVRVGNNIAKIPADRRPAVGLTWTAEDTKQLFRHAWNGTRQEIK